MKTAIDNYLYSDIYDLPTVHQNKIAVVFNKEKYTFRDIKRSVDYLCHKLVIMGVRPGDHVALISMNSYNWLISFYAIIKVGGIAVLVNYIARHNDIVNAVKNTDCKFILYGKYVARAKDNNEFIQLLNDTGIARKNVLSIRAQDLVFKEILKGDIPKYGSPYEREEDSKRTSFLIFTTGTTSEPKAVMLSQYGMMNIIYHNLYKLTEEAAPTFMCLLPMFHCFGLLVVNSYLAYQRVVYINEMSNAKNIYKEFLQAKCGDYASVAIIFDKLARAPFFWVYHGKFVKHCIVGGGFTSEKAFSFLERKYGKGKFLNGYGQTECSPLISLVYPNAPVSKRRETVGVLMDDLEVVIQNPTTKEIIPSNESGEILIKGYNLCNGYYKLPEEKQPFDERGYLHTGDIGFIDDDGYLVLNGRLKDMIVRKGENISPAEIEKAFSHYPEFTRVRVIGVPTFADGDSIIAIVELPNKPLHFHESHYIADLHKYLPSIKIPQHIIYFDSFPLMATGKLDERTLREWAMDKLNNIVDPKLAREVAKIQRQLKKA